MLPRFLTQQSQQAATSTSAPQANGRPRTEAEAEASLRAMAESSGFYPGVNQKVEGVFNRLNVPGTNLKVSAIILDGASFTGVNINGEVFLHNDSSANVSAGGVNVNVKKRRKSWMELWEIAHKSDSDDEDSNNGRGGSFHGASIVNSVVITGNNINYNA